MAKSKVKRLEEQFEKGVWAGELDAMPDVALEISDLKSVHLVPIESSLFKTMEECAKEKRTTVEKLLQSLLKKNLLKAA